MNRRGGSLYPTDEALGLSRPITRRDFIHDVGITAFGLALPLPGLTAPQGGGALFRITLPLMEGPPSPPPDLETEAVLR